MKKPLIRFKTIFLSDVHLGFTDCKIDEVNYFLRHSTCEKLVLNGDIIDAWHLRRWGRWKKEHTHFFRLVLKKAEKYDTEVVYLRGNHDDFLWRVLPFTFDRVQLANEHIHESPHGRYICVHGDAFDAVTSNHRWVSMLGNHGYSLLLRVNRAYNWMRRLRGKEYYSLSQAIKARVKSAVSYIGRYEEQLRKFAARNDCNGIICGHIHTPADKRIGDIHYLNSGDWVESMTAIVETTERELKLITYREFHEMVEAMKRGRAEFPTVSG